jgi:hypothetical protein
MEASEVSSVSYPSIPEKVISAIGVEPAKQLYDGFQQMVSQAAATKVDKSDYDAHAALVTEKFGRFRAETELRIAEAKRETIKRTAT